MKVFAHPMPLASPTPSPNTFACVHNFLVTSSETVPSSMRRMCRFTSSCTKSNPGLSIHSIISNDLSSDIQGPDQTARLPSLSAQTAHSDQGLCCLRILGRHIFYMARLIWMTARGSGKWYPRDKKQNCFCFPLSFQCSSLKELQHWKHIKLLV